MAEHPRWQSQLNQAHRPALHLQLALIAHQRKQVVTN
jgi:hypothetical protein